MRPRAGGPLIPGIILTSCCFSLEFELVKYGGMSKSWSLFLRHMLLELFCVFFPPDGRLTFGSLFILCLLWDEFLIGSSNSEEASPINHVHENATDVTWPGFNLPLLMMPSSAKVNYYPVENPPNGRARSPPYPFLETRDKQHQDKLECRLVPLPKGSC